MRILVPVDGSKYSMAGVKVASHFAKAKIAGIYVMNVIPLVSDIDLELSVSERDLLLETMKRRGEDILEKAKNTLETYGASYIKTILSSSVSVAQEIVNFAEKERMDLIVIGSRGLGATARFVFGSVASKVVKYSPCCVHVVREPSWV